MTSEKMKILEMLSEGKLNVDEATQLLESLQSQTENSPNRTPYSAADPEATPSFVGWLRDIFKTFGPKEKFSETVERTLDGANITAIAAQTANGKITFVGRDGDQIEIQAHKTVKAPTLAEAEAFAAQVQLETETEDGTLRIFKSHPKPPPGYEVSIAYQISGPKALALTLNTSNGKIEAEQVEGAVKAVSSNGKIRLIDVTGSVEARTSNGSIEAQLAQLQQEGHFTTSNGSIQIGVQSGVAPIAAHTSNGSIKLSLPADYSAQVDAKTVNGTVTTDFETEAIEKVKNRFVGKIGLGGETTLKLKTSNGSIRFNKIESAMAVEVS